MNKAMKLSVGTVCSYEVFALTTGLVPTVSTLCRRYWLVEVAVFAGLAADIHWGHLTRRVVKNRVVCR